VPTFRASESVRLARRLCLGTPRYPSRSSPGPRQRHSQTCSLFTSIIGGILSDHCKLSNTSFVIPNCDSRRSVFRCHTRPFDGSPSTLFVLLRAFFFSFLPNAVHLISCSVVYHHMLCSQNSIRTAFVFVLVFNLFNSRSWGLMSLAFAVWIWSSSRQADTIRGL